MLSSASLKLLHKISKNQFSSSCPHRFYSTSKKLLNNNNNTVLKESIKVTPKPPSNSRFPKYLFTFILFTLGFTGVYGLSGKDTNEVRKLILEVEELKEKEKNIKESEVQKELINLEREKSNELDSILEINANELNKLKSQYEKERNELLKRLDEVKNQTKQLNNEKRELEDKINSINKQKDSSLNERENLNKLKVQLSKQLEELSKLEKHQLNELDNNVTIENRDLLVVRIQTLERQLLAKDKILEQLNNEFDLNIKRLEVVNEERINLEKQQIESQLNEKLNQLNDFIEKSTTELEAERNRLEDELIKTLDQQRNDLTTLYKGLEDKRDNQVQNVKQSLDQLENVFNSSISYFTSSGALQKITTALVSLEEATTRRSSFKNELDKLKLLSKNDEFIQTVVKNIPEKVASHGVSTLDELRDRFATVKQKALASSLAPTSTGLFGYVYSKVASFFVVSEEGLVEGDSVNAILARTEFYLKHKRLEDALSEVLKCKEKKNAELDFVLQDWLEAANNRSVIDQSIRAIQSHIDVLSHSIQ
ncbi:hypothetical protein ABK040_004138 [Willaertia magna]